MERVTATGGRGRHQSLLRFNGLKIIFGSRRSYASMLGHGGHAQHQSIPWSCDPLRVIYAYFLVYGELVEEIQIFYYYQKCSFQILVARTRKTYKLDRRYFSHIFIQVLTWGSLDCDYENAFTRNFCFLCILWFNLYLYVVFLIWIFFYVMVESKENYKHQSHVIRLCW